MSNKIEAKKLMIAAASKALDFKIKNPGATNEEAIQHVLESSEEIINNAK